MKSIFVGILASFLLAASPALGVQVSHSENFSFPLSPGNQTLSLPQFDDLGGSLLLSEVVLDLDGTVQANVEAENDSAIAGNMGVSLTGFLQASGSGLSTSAIIMKSAGPVGVTSTIAPIKGGGDYHDFGLISESGSDSDSLTTGFAPFIGTGTINIDILGGAGFSINGVTDSTMWVSGLGASGTATITYIYETPEPATLCLLGLGGLAMLRRRMA
jgi:hypothetical protein